MLKVDFVAQDKAIVRRELQFVIVAKPMKARSFGDDTGRWKGGGVFTACARPERGGGKGREKAAALGLGPAVSRKSRNI